jgi:hypothetical protein
MPIVDFAQDPAAAYGTGNFRDEKGRVMYLHDPETAQQFAKTMPGAKLTADVASESDAIARRQMGAPPAAGPDLRQADARSPTPEARGPGAALVAQYDQTRSVLDAPPSAPADPAGAPAAPVVAPGAPGAPPAAPGAAPSPGAPPGAPPGAATGAGAALVQKYDATQAKLTARSQKPDIEMPKPYGSGGIPLSGVREGQSVSVDEGRPVANAIEQLADEAPEVQNQIDQLRTTGEAKDAATDRAYRAQMANAGAAYGGQVDRVFRASAEQRDAERQLATVQAEIKKNDSSVDSQRVIKRMSTGQRIGMLVLAMLNGAFGATIGEKSNGVVDALNRAVDQDIEQQKLEVANRKASLGNDYKRYLDLGLDAKQAEALARDRAEKALFDYKDLEAKRVGAQGEFARQAELAIAPIRTAWAQRRGDVMKETEAKVKRSQEVSRTNEVPQAAVMTPQDVLAMMAVQNQKIANANTEDIAAAVGHPVTPDEGKVIRSDAQDYGKRLAVIASTKARIAELAKAMKLREGKAGYEGNADPGQRPLGIAAYDEHARDVDRRYALLKRADIMQMVREPSAPLQNEFGQITARPFFDADIPNQLNTMKGLLDDAEKELRSGFSDEALAFYARAKATPRRAGAPAPANPGRPAPSPAERKAANEEQRKTNQMLRESAPGMRPE